MEDLLRQLDALRLAFEMVKPEAVKPETSSRPVSTPSGFAAAFAKAGTSTSGRVPEVHQTTSTPAKRVKLGRNDPCWCGSGKKFKKCHYPQLAN